MEVALYVVEDPSDMNLTGIVHHHLRRGRVAVHKVGLLHKALGVIDAVNVLDAALREIKLRQDITSSG
jgi:hypothetical protein